MRPSINLGVPHSCRTVSQHADSVHNMMLNPKSIGVAVSQKDGIAQVTEQFFTVLKE
jgi:hypothetical protein